MVQDNFQFEFTKNYSNDAKIFVEKIWGHLPPISSFLDFGCGLGIFTKAFAEKGINDFLMVDHPSIPEDQILVRNGTKLLKIDLDHELPPKRQYELIICMEVLEHFSSKRALILLDYITSCSNIILFSAAVPRQLGTGHINERWHNYWHSKFRERGFLYYDGFKTEIIQNDSILYCYRQNAFIYFREDLLHLFDTKKNVTTDNLLLISEHILNRPFGLGEVLKMIPASLMRSFRSFSYKILKKFS